MNCNIVSLRERIGFDKFGLSLASMDQAQRAVVSKLPGIGDKCLIKLHPEAKSSAFGQMVEPAIVAGFIDTNTGIKALVILFERESVDDDESYMFAPVSTIREFKPERVKEFSLVHTRRSK